MMSTDPLRASSSRLSKIGRGGRLSALVLFLLLPLLPACSINPATGERQFNIMSAEQELSIGNESAPQFLESYGGEIPSPPISQYVSDLGHRLAAVGERPELPWEFHVVNSPVINAFSLPGGKVFMSRGLLAKLTNEAQLAGVLGHEIGHVTAEHIGQQMSRATAIQLLGVGLAVAGEKSDSDYMKVLGVGATAAGSLYMLKFSRDEESQADELGVRYMTRLGYNPVAQIQVMEILKAQEQGGASPEFLQTHPYPDTRIERLKQLIQSRYADTQNNDKYVFNPENFQRQVLNRLATLPPAPPPPPQQK